MTSPSAHRVATRFLTAKEWGSIANIQAGYVNAVYALRDHVISMGSGHHDDVFVRGDIVNVVNKGRNLLDYVLQTRSIPKGQEKQLELLGRAFKIKSVPRDVLKWYQANVARLVMLPSATDWPERSESSAGGLDVATVGPLKIHNTIGADATLFEDLKKLVAMAVKLLSASPFKSVLYGDVYVVGQLLSSKTMAWYSVKDDDVYLRSLAKKGRDDLLNLIHELGHRMWFKKMTSGQKAQVTQLYFSLGRDINDAPNPKRPAVGDVLPVPMKGKKDVKFVIVKDDGRFFHIAPRDFLGKLPDVTGSESRVKVSDVLNILKKTDVVGAGIFPSQYSMKNNEEFFAECFAYLLLGRLKPDLAKRFEAAALS